MWRGFWFGRGARIPKWNEGFSDKREGKTSKRPLSSVVDIDALARGELPNEEPVAPESGGPPPAPTPGLTFGGGTSPTTDGPPNGV